MLNQIIMMIVIILNMANIGYVRPAVVDSVDYHAPSECYSTTFESTDGNLWTVDDYVADVGRDCLLVMDSKGTPDITDDEIRFVLTFCEVN